jgi:hypothetical protein
MGSHDPFGFVKHKLWPKERPRVNWQFDYRPLKVRNLLDFLVCIGGVPHIIKKLSMREYNFDLDLTSIEGLHQKLWASKVARDSISRISEFPTWDPGTK